MRRQLLVAIFASVFTAVLVGGVALAAIPGVPSANGVINACYKDAGGAVRLVSRPRCDPGETAIAWNQAGFKKVQTVEACMGTCNGDYYTEVLTSYATCPPGTTRTGGGFRVVPGRYYTGPPSSVEVRSNGPYDVNSWLVTVKLPGLSFQDVIITAVCASA